MDSIVRETLAGLRLGETQMHRNLVIIPILDGQSFGPDYIVLREALEQNLVSITEVSRSGSVPKLKVINKAKVPVLLLDGEELVGAKQNRVVNTTILLKESCKTIIPVSCTERGRWIDVSREFADSDVVMARQARARKAKSVARSLERGAGYRADQAQVWAEVADLHIKACTSSPTEAMHDVFVQREEDMESYLEALPIQEGQVGLVVIMKGKVAGLERISKPDAYASLHDRLVKSYAIEAALDRGSKREFSAHSAAIAFIERIVGLRETQHPSVGYGTDFRYRNGSIYGSALVHEKTCIHMAFFSELEEEQKGGEISEFRDRLRFRFARI